MDPLIGTTIAGRYQVLELIGRGGMGVVYRARQLNIDRDVALKLIRRDLQDPKAMHRFHNEAQIVSKLRHPNTLRLFDCIDLDDAVVMVTEYLRGSPLSARPHGQPLSLERIVSIAEQICAGLAEAHALGVIHRDLKPQNVFIETVVADDVVKVLDFGIAKLAENDPGLTSGAAIMGTPLYMSPEQAHGGALDYRTDIYSLGVILYELVSGRPPFHEGSSLRILHQHASEPPPPLHVLDDRPRGRALQALIMEMLEKEPTERPQSMAEVRHRLQLIRSPTEPQVDLAPPAPRPAAPRAMLLAVALLLLGGAVAYAAWPRVEQAERAESAVIARPAPSPPPPPAPRSVTIESDVPASILDGEGRVLGRTPQVLKLEAAAELQLAADDGRRIALSLDPDRDADRVVRVAFPPAATAPADPKQPAKKAKKKTEAPPQELLPVTF